MKKMPEPVEEKKPRTFGAILRQGELPEYLGISLRTIGRLAARGDFPPKITITEWLKGYRRADVDEWVKNRPQVSQ